MRSMRVLAVAVLAVVLALSAAQNAFAILTLSYDTNNGGGHQGRTYVGVLFSLPSGVSSARLTYLRWSDTSPASALTIHITGPSHDLPELSSLLPIVLTGSPAGTGCPVWWVGCFGLDLTSYGIVVTGDFYVIIVRTGGGIRDDNCVPGVDACNAQRSFTSDTSLATLTTPNQDLFIRMDIDPIIAPVGPVGGFVEPVNKLAVFAPYLALFGVIGAVAVIYWKRPDN